MSIKRFMSSNRIEATVRQAAPGDAEAIGEVRVAAWQAAYKRFLPKAYLSSMNPSENISELRRKLSKQNEAFSVTVAECGGRVVGFAIVGAPRFETKPGAVELWALNVLPSHWRQGVGRAMIEQVVVAAERSSSKTVELWCIAGNARAEHTYSTLGFVASGAERNSCFAGHSLHERHYAKVL